MAKVKAFTDVRNRSLPDIQNKIAGSNYMSNLRKMSVGAGAESVKMDRSGLWAGANKFEDAPFRVGMNGTIYLSMGSGAITIDANGITQYVNGVPVGFWGYQENGF